MKFVLFSMVTAVLFSLAPGSADAALRRFYWTSESQSYQYDRFPAEQDCYARAEQEAYPYAYNTCVQKIGEYNCQYARSYTELLGFTGYPGLYSCKVRVWVEAYDSGY